MNSQRGFVPVIIGIVVLVALVVGGVIYQTTQKPVLPKTDRVTNNSITSTVTADNSTPLTTNWKTYKNDKYGFEFQYPAYAQLSDNTFGKIKEIDVTIQPATDRFFVSVISIGLCDFSYNKNELSIGTASENQVTQDGWNWRHLQYETKDNIVGGYWNDRYYLVKDGACYQGVATGATQSISQTRNTLRSIFPTFKFTK